MSHLNNRALFSERDASRKHPEFMAKHRATKFVMAVEAKARHRDLKADEARPRAGVKGLLVNAAKKRSAHPYAVFVGVNLPPDPAIAPPSWAPEVHGTVDDVVARQGASPFDIVFFTKVPHQYGRAGEADPPKHVYICKPTRRIPMTIDESLLRAMLQYGNIPNDFPTN